MKVDIIKIGNSKGIRIPKAVLEQCCFGDTLEMTVQSGEVVLRNPTRKPRDSWPDAIAKVVAEHGPSDEEPLLGHFPNEFDETEWTWPDFPGAAARSRKKSTKKSSKSLKSPKP